jgi:hypothetical protein
MRPERVVAVERLEPVGHDPGVPVVAVDHIRRPVQGTAELERGATEDEEALAVVVVAVDRFAVEMARRVDEVDRDRAVVPERIVVATEPPPSGVSRCGTTGSGETYSRGTPR